MAAMTGLEGGSCTPTPVPIARRSMKSYELETCQIGEQRLHQVTVTGPITLSERITLYVEALALNETSDLFCIVDNSAGYADDLRYQDMKFLDEMVANYGIRRFVGATITSDAEHAMVVQVARKTAEESGLECHLLSTGERQIAEEFVRGRLGDFAE